LNCFYKKAPKNSLINYYRTGLPFLMASTFIAIGALKRLTKNKFSFNPFFNEKTKTDFFQVGRYCQHKIRCCYWVCYILSTFEMDHLTFIL